MSTLGLDHFSIGDEVEFLDVNQVRRAKVVDVKNKRRSKMPKKYRVSYKGSSWKFSYGVGSEKYDWSRIQWLKAKNVFEPGLLQCKRGNKSVSD